MKLSKSEEELMDLIWKKEKAFMKDIMESYPEPKPAATTIATLLKRMQDKAAIGYKQYGNSREYYPLIKRKEYFSKYFKSIVKNYFDNSNLQFASFFTTTSDLTKDELEELKKIVDMQIKRKKK